MIYTLGRRAVYDPYIASDLSAAKAKGGSVWRTKEDAEAYIKRCNLVDSSGLSIYGVVADWERDTRQLDSEDGWNELTKDAYLIVL